MDPEKAGIKKGPPHQPLITPADVNHIRQDTQKQNKLTKVPPNPTPPKQSS